MPLVQIGPTALKSRLDDTSRPAPVLIDVREPWEVDICRIPGALNIPMNSVPDRLAELDPNAETVVICHHGGRSQQVALFLERNGFKNLLNLAGGVHGWAGEVDPGMPTY